MNIIFQVLIGIIYAEQHGIVDFSRVVRDVSKDYWHETDTLLMNVGCWMKIVEVRVEAACSVL